MNLSQELIEKAAAHMSRAMCPGWKWEEQFERHKAIYLESAREALEKMVPDIRKQVLESAAKECQKIAAEAHAKIRTTGSDEWFNNHTEQVAELCATRIRSLMEKEE